MNRIEKTDISKAMSDCMITYAVASTVRFIPNVIDGLKPVQRRLLYSMYIHDNGNFQKCVNIIGRASEFIETGDAGSYQALIYMGQADRHIHPLIISQGNYGCIIDALDGFAAARYTEGKLSDYAKDWYLTEDLKYTLWKDNYIETTKEPVVLPTLLPMGLVQGSKSIAYGSQNSVLPLDLKSVAKSYIIFLNKYKKKKHMTAKDEEEIIKPLKFKFANNCKVLRHSKNLFTNGYGTVTMCGEYNITTGDYGKSEVNITKLPYLVEIPKFMDKIKSYPDSIKNIISDIRDESSKEGVHIVISLKRGVSPSALVEYITLDNNGFGKTTGIVETRSQKYNYFSHATNKSRDYPVIEIYQEHIDYKLSVLDRYFTSTIMDLEHKLKYLEALLYIISDKKRLDDFYMVIRKSDRDTLGSNLHKKFKNIEEDILLYIADKKFTVMLKNNEDIKNQIKDLKTKIERFCYYNNHKIDYIIEQIETKLKKY